MPCVRHQKNRAGIAFKDVNFIEVFPEMLKVVWITSTGKLDFPPRLVQMHQICFSYLRDVNLHHESMEFKKCQLVSAINRGWCSTIACCPISYFAAWISLLFECILHAPPPRSTCMDGISIANDPFVWYQAIVSIHSFIEGLVLLRLWISFWRIHLISKPWAFLQKNWRDPRQCLCITWSGQHNWSYSVLIVSTCLELHFPCMTGFSSASDFENVITISV